MQLIFVLLNLDARLIAVLLSTLPTIPIHLKCKKKEKKREKNASYLRHINKSFSAYIYLSARNVHTTQQIEYETKYFFRWLEYKLVVCLAKVKPHTIEKWMGNWMWRQTKWIHTSTQPLLFRSYQSAMCVCVFLCWIRVFVCFSLWAMEKSRISQKKLFEYVFFTCSRTISSQPFPPCQTKPTWCDIMGKLHTKQIDVICLLKLVFCL